MVYIKGAITEPCVRTIIEPKTMRTIIRGTNQYFFLTLINKIISLNNENILKLIFH